MSEVYKYRDEYAKQLIEHMQKGYSFYSFSAVIGIPLSVLTVWSEDIQEFHDARQLGEAHAFYYFEKAGMENFEQLKKKGKLDIKLWQTMLLKTMIGRNILRPNWKQNKTEVKQIAINSLLDRLSEVKEESKQLTNGKKTTK